MFLLLLNTKDVKFRTKINDLYKIILCAMCLELFNSCILLVRVPIINYFYIYSNFGRKFEVC